MANILLVVGTNRPGANSLRVAEVIREIYSAAGVEVDCYSLHQMPVEIFDPRSYVAKPESWLPVQDMVVKAKGIHLITPEYNGSFPGVLKYFIDMLKFPDSFLHKPVAFVGVSAGMWGALRPVEQLQHVFGYRNAHVFPDRVFIPHVSQRFDAQGNFIDQEIRQKLEIQANGFVRFCEAVDSHSHVLQR